MVNKIQQTKAATFLNYHQGPTILILPNAWDAASARIFEDAGFRAIGTTSAGIAASHGYLDVQRISRNEMMESVKRIVRTVELPVSADIEAGYADTAEEFAKTIEAVIAAGAVGINIEDSPGKAGNPLADISSHVEKIKIVREVASASEIPLVLNARIDVYWFSVGDVATRYEHTVRRAKAYRQAGADCIFVPRLTDSATIANLVKEVRAPINVLATPGESQSFRVLPIAELQRLGVARVSFGSGLMRATLALCRRIAKELLGQETYNTITQDTIPYAEVERLLEKQN